jgi:hypothetical protein
VRLQFCWFVRYVAKYFIDNQEEEGMQSLFHPTTTTTTTKRVVQGLVIEDIESGVHMIHLHVHQRASPRIIVSPPHQVVDHGRSQHGEVVGLLLLLLLLLPQTDNWHVSQLPHRKLAIIPTVIRCHLCFRQCSVSLSLLCSVEDSSSLASTPIEHIHRALSIYIIHLELITRKNKNLNPNMLLLYVISHC